MTLLLPPLWARIMKYHSAMKMPATSRKGRKSYHQGVTTGARYSTVKRKSLTETSSRGLPCRVASI